MLKKIITSLAAFVISANTFSQCISTVNYPLGVHLGPAQGQTIAITTSTGNCSYSGEYFTVNLAFGYFTFTSSNHSDILTLTDVNNNVIFNDVESVNIALPSNSTYRLHVNNSSCTPDTICRGISLYKGGTLVPPNVSTGTVTNITNNSAVGNGFYNSSGTTTPTAVGFCYGTSPNPTISGPHTNSSNITSTFTSTLTGLLPGTLYHVRAYGKGTSSLGGTYYGYGSDVTFTTTGTAPAGCIATAQYPTTTVSGPTLNNQTVDITTLADCNYSGEYAAVSLGVGNYTLTSSTSTDYFTVTNTLNSIQFTGIQPLTFFITTAQTYYIHIFQDNICTVNNVCRAISITKNVTVATLPTVTTTAVTAITSGSATSGGNVTSAGSSSVYARGICYSTSPNPTIADLTVSTGSGLGLFTSNMSNGISPSTTYHVRAYATNNSGTAYGADLTFTTIAAAGCIGTSQYPNIPVTGPTSNGQTVAVTLASSTCNYSGEYSVVTLGVGSYTLTSSISTDFFTVTDGANAPLISGTQPLNFTITTYGTYRFHIYSGGNCLPDNTCRGVSVTKNSSGGLATVTTIAVTAITSSSATAGGDVTNGGSATVTSRGVCFAVTANPTIADASVASGSGTGTFSVNLSGLTSGTYYHIRAYAINSVGIAYGSDLTFNTAPQTLASVSTTAATSVTTTTAISGGVVTSAGSSYVTSRGICYATTTNPTLANSVVSGGSGTGSFTSTLSGLTPNTSYYIRAYVTNTGGTAYGNQVTFTTASPAAPSVSSVSASAVSYFSANAGGNVLSIGSSAVTDRGVCYSTFANPTLVNAYVSGGSGSGVFSVNLTGLSGNTTYHYRSYATNNVGTTYGSDMTFTTLNPCETSTEVYLTNLAFMDLATANATPAYYSTYVTPNAQGLPGLPGNLSFNALNPYNLVNPGLPVRMKVKSYNNKTNGTSVVSGSCKLRTNDPNISITDSIAGLNNVGWHNEAWSTDEFEFQISYAVFTSYTAYVEVVIEEGANKYYTRCIPIPIRAFTVGQVDVDDDNNPDSNGNNNGLAEPNETVEFLPYINNSSTFSASYVAGFVMNFDYLSNVSIWDNHIGSSGNVYAQGWWNYSFAQPQPIPAGTNGTLPEYDFVFDYIYTSTYRFDLHLMMAGGFNLLDTPNNLTLMRTSTPLTFNPNNPAIPPTGINAIAMSNEINVYPNPFSNELSVRVKTGLEHAKYTITNPLGSVVASGYLEGTKTSINLEKLAAGLYNLTINGQSSIKISKK